MFVSLCFVLFDEKIIEISPNNVVEMLDLDPGLLHGVLPGPLPGALVVLGHVSLVQPGNLGNKRVVGVGVAQ